MKLWLDDVREPAKHGCLGFVWAKNYEEAIEYLKTGEVTYASLDHDLGIPSCKKCRAACTNADEYGDVLELGCEHGEKTGYHVVCWMEENNVWPAEGVNVHSANPAGRKRMQMVVDKHYRGVWGR